VGRWQLAGVLCEAENTLFIKVRSRKKAVFTKRRTSGCGGREAEAMLERARDSGVEIGEMSLVGCSEFEGILELSLKQTADKGADSRCVWRTGEGADTLYQVTRTTNGVRDSLEVIVPVEIVRQM
jgi:hypothetical protein